MNKLEAYFIMRDGKSVYPDLQKFRDAISALSNGYYINRIIPVGNKRSIKQNNSMWGIPYLYFEKVLEATGEYKNISDLQVHEWCMHHCLPEDYKERIRKEWDEDKGMIDVKTGEVFKSAFRLTTTKMTTKEAMNYYENLQMFYSEWFSSGKEGDSIPDPDPDYKNKKS